MWYDTPGQQKKKKKNTCQSHAPIILPIEKWVGSRSKG